MSDRQREFKNLIKYCLEYMRQTTCQIDDEIDMLDSELYRTISDQDPNVIKEIIVSLTLFNKWLDEIKRDIENFTDEDFCPWGDEEMIYHHPKVIDLCIGNTLDDLKTIVSLYWVYTGKCNVNLNRFPRY